MTTFEGRDVNLPHNDVSFVSARYYDAVRVDIYGLNFLIFLARSIFHWLETDVKSFFFRLNFSFPEAFSRRLFGIFAQLREVRYLIIDLDSSIFGAGQQNLERLAARVFFVFEHEKFNVVHRLLMGGDFINFFAPHQVPDDHLAVLA